MQLRLLASNTVFLKLKDLKLYFLQSEKDHTHPFNQISHFKFKFLGIYIDDEVNERVLSFIVVLLKSNYHMD